MIDRSNNNECCRVTLAFLSLGAFFGFNQYTQDAQESHLREIQNQRNMQMQIEQASN